MIFAKRMSQQFFPLSVLVVFSVLAVFWNSAFAKSKAEAPAIDISTCTDLQKMNNNPSGQYELTTDIDCTGVKFAPIELFYGIFDGALHTIKNLTINSLNDNIGLFSGLSNAQISHLNLQNVQMTGKNAVGALAGYASGSTISDVHAQGKVTGILGSNRVGGLIGDMGLSTIQDSSAAVDVAVPASPSSYGVGGLAGYSSGNIIRSYATGSVTSGGAFVGGLAGYFSGSITDSHASGTVTSQNGSDVGGLVGAQQNFPVTNSYATGDVKGTGVFVGGLLGNTSYVDVVNSYATGAVTATAQAGGLIGVFFGFNNKVSNSYASGAVSCPSIAGGLIGVINNGYVTSSYAIGQVLGSYTNGGLIGYMNGGSVTDSFATGAVSGVDSSGGLVGIKKVDAAVITNTYATGVVSGSVTNIGGLIGSGSSANVTNSYWDMQTSGQPTSIAGIGKTTSQMYQQNTYSGWDFAHVWNIHEGNSYPWLHATNYEISNCAELSTIQQNLNGAYRLIADIDCTGTALMPIGNSTQPFTGMLDGEGYAIINAGIKAGGQDFIGLFGATRNAVITHLLLKNINVSGQKNVGALIGYAYDATQVTQVTANGMVVASGSEDTSNIGGLIGGLDSKGMVTHSFANITVNAGTANIAGGLVGLNNGWIANSYAAGAVTGLSVVGGLVGDNEGSINYSYAVGQVTGSKITGGLIGAANVGAAVSSYWDTETSGQATSAGGNGKTSAEMHKQSTFTGWDFINIWNINDGISYPLLQNQPGQ